MHERAPIVMERSELPKQQLSMPTALKSDYYIDGDTLSFNRRLRRNVDRLKIRHQHSFQRHWKLTEGNFFRGQLLFGWQRLDSFFLWENTNASATTG